MRRHLDILLLALVMSVLLAGLESMALATIGPGVAQDPVPSDGTTLAADYLGRRLGMKLGYSPGLGAISHTGYFSDNYQDVAGRDPGRSLGAPPFPATSPTAFFVGYDGAAIPAFARTSLEKGKTYYWAVDEFDGVTVWPGEVWSFTVMPEKAWGPEPADDSSDIVAEPHAILGWHIGDVDALGNTVSYDIYYGTDSSVVAAATEPNVTVTTEEYALVGLSPGIKYFWCVDTILKHIDSPFQRTAIRGDIWSFRVIVEKEQAWGPIPSDGAVNIDTDAGLTLIWKAGDVDTELYAIEYDVYHGTDAQAVNSGLTPNATTESREFHIGPIADETKYFWRVNVILIEKSPPFERRAIKGNTWSFTTLGFPWNFSVDDDGPADFATIQDAVDAATHADIIVVRDGIYVGSRNRDIDFKGKAITIRSRKGSENCIIDCQGQGRGFYFHSGENPAAVVDGFTIINGNASQGGGIYTTESSPTIRNCIMKNNRSGYGGGMYVLYGGPRVTNCVFTANEADWAAGMANAGSTTVVENCSFVANKGRVGIAMANSSANTTIKNCTFIHHRGIVAGAIWNDRGDSIFTNCFFSDNASGWGGGGAIHQRSGNVTLVSCTLSDNYDAVCIEGGHLMLTNCILWNDYGHVINLEGGTAQMTFSDVRGGWPGEGNINADPCFVDPENHDCRLLPDSPCINAGDPNYTPSYGERDINSESRVMDGRVDMGADEFNPLLAVFVVVAKERVGRSLFEYECEIRLENVSRFGVWDVRLEMVGWPQNVTIVDPTISFGDAEIGPGESATSVDNCIFRVDRSKPIDSAEIVWRVAGESADSGERMECTSSSLVPPGPEPVGFDGLRDIAAEWLWQGLAGGVEEDKVEDGTVNLADFARFAEQWQKN
ncbi:MAG: right-handed parallel beta-helix repeat-containing protein [Phycisphaerae bacterium]|nr:right-handed parallel beta-helix repeat-containing protein [Phycisphaerae bacterium]